MDVEKLEPNPDSEAVQLSNCTFCGRDEKPERPGELCPGEKLEPMKATDFDVEEETGTRVLAKAADPKLPTPEEVDSSSSEGKVRLWTTGALGETS